MPVPSCMTNDNNVNSTGTRCTDADRNRVTELLGSHYAAGSLDDEEFQRRTDKAVKAVYRSELTCLTLDLPALPSQARPARRYNYPYRTWSSTAWTWQNVLAVTGVVAITGAVGTNSAAVVPAIVIASLANAFLGWRKSGKLAVTGALLGFTTVIGVVLMVILTVRRRKGGG